MVLALVGILVTCGALVRALLVGSLGRRTRIVLGVLATCALLMLVRSGGDGNIWWMFDGDYTGDLVALGGLVPAVATLVVAAPQRIVTALLAASAGLLLVGIGTMMYGGSGSGWDFADLLFAGVMLAVAGARADRDADTRAWLASPGTRAVPIVVGGLIVAIPLLVIGLIAVLCWDGCVV